jgi:hypothetical protein
MWLPKLFYGLIPYLYVVVGLISVLLLETYIGFALGSLALLTAYLIWMERRGYRKGRPDIDL